jgi:hypothetical protein
MLRVLVTLLVSSATTFGSSGYTHAMFTRAMAQYNGTVTESGRPLPPPKPPTVTQVRIGVSPLYLLMNLRDPKSGSQREICVLNHWLEAAIAEEYHLDLADDQRKIFDIAMAAPNRVFQFRTRKARAYVAAAYTPDQLAKVRQLLRGKSRRELRKEATVELLKEPNQQSSLTKIYRRDIGKRFWSSEAYKLAVAHVLLEHGILVGEAHDLGILYVD